jgi:hypothetical protein
MFFQRIDNTRYRVLDEEGGKLLGSVNKESFRTYPNGLDGDVKEGCFWLAHSRGYMQVPGKFASRKAAAEALIESLPVPKLVSKQGAKS